MSLVIHTIAPDEIVVYVGTRTLCHDEREHATG